MESDDEHNATDELQPRTSLRPTPAPFSHAPFKSAVPEVSLILNNTPNPATVGADSSNVNTTPTPPKSSSEDFESYNAWRHKNLKNADESSPRFKYYATSPRYSNDVLSVKTNTDQFSDSPRMAPLQPINYRIPQDNLPSDSFQRLRNNSPVDRSYDSPAINHQHLSRDINISQNPYDPKYRNSKTLPEQFQSSPSIQPSSNRYQSLQTFQQTYQQSPQPRHFFEQNNQSIAQNQIIFPPNNYVNSPFRNQSPERPSKNFFQHQNYIGPEIVNHRELYYNQTQERTFVNENFARNERILGQERSDHNVANHRGQGDCFSSPLRNVKEQESVGNPSISVGDLYRLIQMQNEEIRGLRAQVQGLLDSKKGEDACESTRNTQQQSRDFSDLTCQAGNTSQPSPTREQFRQERGSERQENRQVDVEADQANSQNDSNFPNRRNLQQTNAQRDGRNEFRNGSDGNSQIQTTHESQDWDRSTNFSAVNGDKAAGRAINQQNGMSNHRASSNRNFETRQSIGQHNGISNNEANSNWNVETRQNINHQNGMSNNEPSSNRNFELEQGHQGNGTSNNRGRSNRNAETNRPIACQSRAVVQQVSIGVMTSFVDQNVYYKTSAERVPPKSNALLRQATAGGAGRHRGQNANDDRDRDARVERADAQPDHCQGHGAAETDQGNGASCSACEDGGRSLTLGRIDIEAAREQERSPDGSMHLDLQDFRSGSSCSSAEEDAPRVGWTFYHNMVGQVNEMLHTNPNNQRQQPDDSCENSYEASEEFRRQNQPNGDGPPRINVAAAERSDKRFENDRQEERNDHQRANDVPNETRNERYDKTRRRNDLHDGGRDLGHVAANRVRRRDADVDEYRRGFDEGRHYLNGRQPNERNCYRGQENGRERPARDPAVNRAVADRPVAQFDKEAVRKATIQQLRRLGVSMCDQDGNTAVAAPKKVTFDSVYYVPRAAFSGANVLPASDVSMRMDALAMKYLHGDQLDEYARLPGNGPQEMTVYDLASKMSNVSIATMRYLERYQLLPVSADQQPQAAPLVEQPRRMPTQDAARNNFRPMPPDCNQWANPPHKILDITALKQQPKFI